MQLDLFAQDSVQIVVLKNLNVTPVTVFPTQTRAMSSDGTEVGYMGRGAVDSGKGRIEAALFAAFIACAGCTAEKVTGVTTCDDYLAKVERCIAKHVPKSDEKAQRDRLERMRAAWVAMAKDPGARPGLSQVCGLALDGERTRMEGYHCGF